MKTFADRLREDRRLVVLRLLEEQPQFCLNSSNVHMGLQHLKVPARRDDVITDIHWLRDQGLVVLEEVPDVTSLYLVTLTSRGHDVATGAARVPGVSHPHPR